MPRYDPRVRLFLDGWRDITSDVRYSPGITIERGASEEATTVEPAQVRFTLDNRSGDYSPKNPLSPYYGRLRQNTPCEVSLRHYLDEFDRTVASGWGQVPDGPVWSVEGTASNYAVSGGAASHSIASAGAWRLSYLANRVYADVDVVCVWSCNIANITGGDIEPCNIVLRMVSTTDYYMARLVVKTDETMTLSIHSFIDGEQNAPVTLPLTYSAGTQYAVRFAAEGDTVRAKVWLASEPEPWDWPRILTWSGIPATGWVGVRTGVASGNTNLPVVVQYHEFQVSQIRAVAEIAEWPARWDRSGRDVTATVTASGMLRRLGRTDQPIMSALRRTIPTGAGLIAYWPLEDGEDSTVAATGMSSGGVPMRLVAPLPNFGSYTGFKCSAPLPTMNGSRLGAFINAYPASGALQVRWLMHIPTGGDTATMIGNIWTYGTAMLWEIHYLGSGNMQIKAWDQSFVQILDFSPLGVAPEGKHLLMSLELVNSGSNVNYNLVYIEVGATSGLFHNGTLVGHQIGNAWQSNWNPFGALQSTALGHIHIKSTVESIFLYATQLKAYAGDKADARAGRLADENNVPFEFIGEELVSAAMGPQTVQPLMDLLEECAAADMGLLYESRSAAGIGYRTIRSMYNQAARLTLDYAEQHIAPPMEPVADDQLLRNDVTANRTGGSSFQVVQEDGPFAVAEPQDGGIGRYDRSVTVNVQSDTQLRHVAGWQVHLGTTEDDRYPALTVDASHPHVIRDGLLPAILDVNVGDRVLVENPFETQASEEITQLVRGYTEEFSTTSYRATFRCVPASPYEVVVLDSSTRGRIDSGSSTLHESMTTSSTSVKVATGARNDLWSTSAEPYNIMVGGEEMTVTAVTDTVPSFVNVGTAAHADNASVSPGIPAGATAGDLLLLFAANSDFAATVNVPAGYVSLLPLANIHIMGKIHSGSESAPTVTFGGSGAGDTCSAQIAALRDTPLNLIAFSQQFNASAQNIAYPALQVPMADSIAIYMGWKQDDWTSVATIPGATEIGEPSSTLGSDQGLVWDYRVFHDHVDIPAGSFVVTGGGAAASRGMVLVFGNWQTFTVTRAVNGIVKPHSAGEPVHVWPIPRLAY